VRDRALASRVLGALLAHPQTRKYRITVEADQGTIQLEGTAALDTAAEVARTVPGVVNVVAQLVEVGTAARAARALAGGAIPLPPGAAPQAPRPSRHGAAKRRRTLSTMREMLFR
jgi:hypothetical protein